MSTARYFNADAHEYRDTFTGSDRDKRLIDDLIARDDARLAAIMSDQYESATSRLASDLESVVRICGDGEGLVDDILDDLRNGEITASEAAKRLGAARRDLNRLRKVASEAAGTEERVWSEVNTTPGQYQRAIAKRLPSLFAGGRGLLELPTYDD